MIFKDKAITMKADRGKIRIKRMADTGTARRFSKYYASGLQEWINGRYHVYGQEEPEPNAT